MTASLMEGQRPGSTTTSPDPKTLMRSATAEGAGAHRHSGAQRLAMGRIYDWLDDAPRPVRG
ncbi:hypothetical protein AB0M36_05735 [Actinoplanes sp. NPDC051346]|uniref:hypothetical protein n=1 Tax=Actinoplanes sp. NPDC051346 TaxID=3155048 RepID=UPI00343CED25